MGKRLMPEALEVPCETAQAAIQLTVRTSKRKCVREAQKPSNVPSTSTGRSPLAELPDSVQPQVPPPNHFNRTRSQRSNASKVVTALAAAVSKPLGAKPRRAPKTATAPEAEVAEAPAMCASAKSSSVAHQEPIAAAMPTDKPAGKARRAKVRPAPEAVAASQPGGTACPPCQQSEMSLASHVDLPAIEPAAAHQQQQQADALALSAPNMPALVQQSVIAPDSESPGVQEDEVFDPSSLEHVSAVQAHLSGAACARKRRQGACAAPLGRDQQYNQLTEVLETSLKEGRGAALYLSGLPGTGKSHTVASVLAHVVSAGPSADAPPTTAHVNCMALTDASDIYAALLRSISSSEASGTGRTADGTSGPHPAREAAYQTLVTVLQSLSQKAGRTGHRSSKMPGSRGSTGGRGSGKKGAAPAGRQANSLVVIVLDEVDRLADKAHEELYRLFMLPHLPGMHVVLIAIANGLDFTDRELPKLLCRGCQPTHLPFPAYDRTQVQAVLESRLSSLPWPHVFEHDALEMVARNVANNSGDLRHAIKACCLALDIVHTLHKAADSLPAASSHAPTTSAAAAPSALPRSVGVRQVSAALQKLAGSGSTAAAASTCATVAQLPVQQQLVLLAVSKAVAAAQDAKKKHAETTAAQAEGGDYSQGGGAYIGPVFTGRAYEAGPPTLSDLKRKPAKPSSHGSIPPAPKSTGRWQPAGGSSGGGKAGGALGGGWQVPLADARAQYEGLCRELLMRPMTASEFLSASRLLDASALVRLVGTSTLGLRVTGKDVAAALRGNVIYKKLFPQA